MYKTYIHETFGSEFEVLGEYVNNLTEIRMYHLACGREFDVRPGNFKTRKRCPLCNGSFRKTTEQFRAEVKRLVGDEYIVIGEYEGAKESIAMKHVKCGHEYSVAPTDFISGGNRCPDCARNKTKNTEIFKSEVRDIAGDDYVVIGEYVTSKTPLQFMHTKCGSYFSKTPELFLIGHRCNDCGIRKRSGENHYKYNPNLTPEEREKREMHNGEIKKWRDRIFARDNYTCAVCSEYGGRLNAHHLNSWDNFKDERFELTNGVTLCEKCHKGFHGNYGYGNNTREQFMEYVKSL